jgi:predicted dehydrogenase
MATSGFGIVGAGLWGSTHARVYGDDPRVRLVGICDADAARARALAEKSGAAMATDDLGELLSQPGLDAVSIVTPDFAHTEAALAAARAGKHVLIEKPLATTVEECESIIAAAREAGVKLMVDFHNRWNPPFHRARRAIEEGEIGTPQFASYRLSDTIYVPTKMIAWAGRSTVAWFLATHCLDTLRWLMGDEVARVYCVSRSRVLAARGVNTPDYYQTTLEFRGGATAFLEVAWILPEGSPSLIDLKCELVGDRGAFYIDGSHHRALEIQTAERSSYPDMLVMPTVYGQAVGFAYQSIRHFVDCVANDQPPVATGEDGLAVTRIICAMEESARTGQAVEV